MPLPSQFHPFRPRLVDSLRGYNRHQFLSDAAAGLTVGVVALPLAMAFAIASGLKPEQGIITAIVEAGLGAKPLRRVVCADTYTPLAGAAFAVIPADADIVNAAIDLV